MRVVRANESVPDFLVERAPQAGLSARGSAAVADVPLGGAGKRLLDILLVILSLPLLLPLMAGIAVLLKLTSPGPLLYGHRRIGFQGRAFRCWKFRTMVVDGDRVLDRYLQAHPQEAAVWAAQRKLDNDPRVTRVGAVLRKLSLDELPQLLNVLSGEMSLVGPRPVVQAELDEHYGSAASAYLSARPGLTGLWQISGRSDTTYAERIRLDCRYVRRWTLWGDLRIILLTIPALALSRGAR
ncbi:sugar transferase [Paracoccus contaminans]|uniref:Bacterial sugar transferase domain-containing protein n=1 Tax=Paracoccus contaminans TaxID=1945662 RepID=A0A1W6CVT9_9RHOB|nr:sugar transferase [Paracoccus contaminans]ARJ68966.1 hypothetical protein B0A89_04300 [Paracoccus contaminans]